MKADLEAHAGTLALLAIDLADMPPDRLERAIAVWVKDKVWMPKAAELIQMCQAELNRETAPKRANGNMEDVEALCDHYNSLAHKERNMAGKRFVPDGPNAVKIVSDEFANARR